MRAFKLIGLYTMFVLASVLNTINAQAQIKTSVKVVDVCDTKNITEVGNLTAEDLVFKDLYDLSISTQNAICKSLLVSNDTNSPLVKGHLSNFLKQGESIFANAFPDELLTQPGSAKAFYSKMGVLIEGGDIDKMFVAKDNLPNEDEDMAQVYYWDRSQLSFIIKDKTNDLCFGSEGNSSGENNKLNCFDYSKQYSAIFNLYAASINQQQTSANEKVIKGLRSSWDRFAEESRGQYLLDVWATTIWHRDYYSNDEFVAPANSQIFFMHPTIVYEHLPDLERGSRDGASVALEVFGINWWDLKVPFGFSYAPIYSDRAGVSSIAHSLMLHVDNQYSFGFTFRDKNDGGNGIYFSLNLLNLLEDKQAKIDKYFKQF